MGVRYSRLIIRWLILFSLIGSILWRTSVHAEMVTIGCGDDRTAELNEAIMIANRTAAIDTIVLAAACTYTMTHPAIYWTAFNTINTPIIIEGNGAIIERSSIEGTEKFRFFALSQGGDLTLKNVTLRNGHSDQGGAIINSGSLTLIDSTITHNSSDGSGGAIYNMGTMLLVRTTITHNSALDYNGGGIDNRGPSIIQDSTISENTAQLLGGGILNSSVVTIEQSTISENTAGAGGGIDNTLGGEVQLVQSTISDNTALYRGGGIWTDALVSLKQSTVSGNTAQDNGGGMYIRSYFQSVVRFEQSTVSGNTAQKNGGGLFSENAFELFIVQSTFTNNTAQNAGGGIYTEMDLFNLDTSIVAGNSAQIGPDIVTATASGGSVISHGYNLIGNNDTAEYFLPTGTPNNNNDWVGSPATPINPLLGSLIDNGGPTLTHLPLEGSPAINHGPATSSFFTDQRGMSRIQSSFMDIGSVEVASQQYLVVLPMLGK